MEKSTDGNVITVYPGEDNIVEEVCNLIKKRKLTIYVNGNGKGEEGH